MPGTGLPAIGDEIAGKYRVESVLGQGGMGAVFAARNVRTGKRVAIKWLLPEHAATDSRERLLREARIAGSIDHPNVVDIYDVGEHDGGMFLVMEYLRGRPLSDILAERGRLDPEELIPLVVPAMRGVHAAHAAGVVHRDLKPENIFLSEIDGTIVPKVVDFGVSKSMNSTNAPPSSLTRAGALVGTPHYMALEQVDGTNELDVRTDVYAFGVLLYRALTGHFPFDGSSLGEVILKIGTKDPTPPRALRPDLAPELEQIVLRALCRDRAQRFQDLEDLARALLPFGPRTNGSLSDPARTSGTSEPAARLASGSSAPPRSVRSILGDPAAVPGAVSVSMLGAAVSQQGAAPRHTPMGPASNRSPARGLWGAALAVVLLVGGLGVWAMLGGPSSVVSGATPLPRVPSEPSLVPAPEVARAAASSTHVTPVALAGAVAGDVPGQGSVVAGESLTAAPADAAARAAGDLELAVDAAVLGLGAGLGESEDVRSSGKIPAGMVGKRTRPAGGPKTHPTRFVPGERTKGLSPDDF